ncbi:SDR family NAD(P)-dependent oxidoreductase [Sphingobium sufflavum]|uniref:SDR family NAD(P)-dependent oxidoreductase n=1 Tax=Sphingobium sufflavum TaxID=1129547 RepID=UPI001F38EB61|nr:SDR family NAD(P)-dependent oxidoreductase [Sphingobium sufflavum]MCE7797081.1 SDR family NAD(P)-dependent oxidoreductase [Sphingobium sufflavum]
MTEKGCIAVVTGASRGAGRGIAIGLGAHGCTVYVTGRSEKTGDASMPGTIYETADAITAAGGKGIAVRVDHGDDAQVKAFFEQVEREQGRIDILVNNAAAVHDELTTPGNFWEKPLKLADMIDVGIRSGYVASYYAAPMMVKAKHGLMIFTSGSGGVHYVFGPAYGAHKAGVDKLAADMGVDFTGLGVTALSIWMGALLTDRLKHVIATEPEKYAYLADVVETPEFTGHVIWALYNDPDLIAMNGQTVIGAEMAVKYGLTDEGGRQPPSYRDTHKIEPRVQYPNIIR